MINFILMKPMCPIHTSFKIKKFKKKSEKKCRKKKESEKKILPSKKSRTQMFIIRNTDITWCL